MARESCKRGRYRFAWEGEPPRRKLLNKINRLQDNRRRKVKSNEFQTPLFPSAVLIAIWQLNDQEVADGQKRSSLTADDDDSVQRSDAEVGLVEKIPGTIMCLMIDRPDHCIVQCGSATVKF